jgi:hypothetical protein
MNGFLLDSQQLKEEFIEKILENKFECKPFFLQTNYSKNFFCFKSNSCLFLSFVSSLKL